MLRSHPKDERGSVREIRLCVSVPPTLHFLELMRLLCWELTNCSEWSFSSPFWDPEREREWIPKWTRNGTENGPPKGTLRKDLKDGSLRVEVYEDSKSSLKSNLKPKLEVDGRSQGRTRTRPRIPSLAELPLHSSQVWCKFCSKPAQPASSFSIEGNYGSSRCSGASWSCCEAIRRMREGV